jgi:hypothetical protein
VKVLLHCQSNFAAVGGDKQLGIAVSQQSSSARNVSDHFSKCLFPLGLVLPIFCALRRGFNGADGLSQRFPYLLGAVSLTQAKCLLRPDGYVALSVKAKNARAIETYSSRLYQE